MRQCRRKPHILEINQWEDRLPSPQPTCLSSPYSLFSRPQAGAFLSPNQESLNSVAPRSKRQRDTGDGRLPISLPPSLSFLFFFFQLDEWLEWGPDTRVRSSLHQLGRTRVRAGSWLSLSALHTARQGLVAEGCGYTWMQVCSQEAGRRWR